MFFKAHPEGKIGYKKLSDPDLGRSSTSHQTHIGLYDDILTFLPNQNVEDKGMFIYNDKAEFIDYSFDRIGRKNGEFNSPKIKKGGRNTASVVTLIHDEEKKADSNLDWFLIWFGLESEEVVFYLFNNKSEDYKIISKSINLTDVRVKGRVDSLESRFGVLISYLENIVNQNNIETIKDLEIASQIGFSKKYRAFDIKKANERFSETGRIGEELVAEYLEKQKSKGYIFHFTWFNKDQESGLPYDFTIQDNNQNIIHIDVKSTSFEFDRPMIFSNQEIDFINTTPYYQIYRVYNIYETERYFRVCENSKVFIPNLHISIAEFNKNIQTYNVALQTVKLSLSPNIKSLIFKSEIKL